MKLSLAQLRRRGSAYLRRGSAYLLVVGASLLLLESMLFATSRAASGTIPHSIRTKPWMVRVQRLVDDLPISVSVAESAPWGAAPPSSCCRGDLVFVDEAAEQVAALQPQIERTRAGSLGWRRVRVGRSQLESAVRPPAVVVTRIDAEDAF